MAKRYVRIVILGLSNGTDGAATRLHALIIGIDDYKIEVPKLKGAVSDATKVYEWVTSVLGASQAQVRFLKDKQATREAIIRELVALSTNTKIEHGDPILIYYAGHGSEAPAPKEWHWDSPTIQMILPFDFRYPIGPNRTVQGIPDRTLGYVLSEISKKKGNNIAVIFDCCNSGSGTRAISDTRVRGVPHLGPLPDDVDDGLFSRTRGLRNIPPFRHQGLNSHVLLAACGPNERAHENNNAGEFTTALLRVLRDADLTELTYEGLIDGMEKLKSQTPQCEGVHRGRILFNNRIPNQGIILDASLKKDVLTINGAGAIHGIAIGSKFAIWRSRTDIGSTPIAAVTVDIVGDYWSSAKWDTPSSKSRFVAQLKGNLTSKLDIFVPEVVQRMPCFRQLFVETSNRTPPRVAVVSREQARIGLVYTEADDAIGFEILDPAEQEQVIIPTVPPVVDELCQALQLISNYYHHRTRVNAKRPTLDDAPFFSQFSLEIFRVFEENGGDTEAMGAALVRTGPNRNIEGAGFEVIVEPHQNEAGTDGNIYGFKIENHTKNIDVYPYLFYFNSSDFSISPIYVPDVKIQGQAPLKRKDFLSIGYGSTGDKYQDFALFPGLNLELGYLVLYVSTEEVKSLSSMAQVGLSGSSTRGLRITSTVRPPAKIWDCITVPVKIKRETVTTPSHIIGVLGSSESRKQAFLEQLFRSVNEHEVLKPTFESPMVKEYTLDLPNSDGRAIAIADLPSLQNEDVDQQLAALKAIVSYLAPQYQQNRHFISLIWCYNISKQKFNAEDALNLSLVKDLAGREFFKNIVVVTTGWHRGPSTAKLRMDPRSVSSKVQTEHPYSKIEREIKTQIEDCRELLAGGAIFKRFGEYTSTDKPDITVDDPLTLVRSLLTKPTDNQPLQVQSEACDTRTLTGTTAGKSLRERIRAAIEEKDEEIKELEQEAGDGVEDEKFAARQEIERWTKALKGIDWVGSALV